MHRQNYSQKTALDRHFKTHTCLKWTDFYAPSAYFTYVRRTSPFFHGKGKRKGCITKKKFHFFKKNFHFHALKLFLQSSYLWDTMLFEAIQSPFHSQQKVLVLIGISSPTPTRLFILVSVTLQLAYDLCKRRNFFNVLLRKKGNVYQLLLV